MKKFAFRLQRVLDIRNLEERQEKQRFAEVYGGYRKIEVERDGCHDAVAATFGQVQDAISTGESWLLQAIAGSLSGNEAAVTRLNADLEKESYKLEKAREDLIAATRRKRALELLKDKAFAQYTFELDREERSDIDEISGQQYIRRREEQAQS